jgi:hypothetical protein
MSDKAESTRAGGRASDAADSILGNEALTGHLDDAQARILLDRVLEALDTLDAQAASDEDFESGAKALRRFMRRVDAWIADGASAEGRGLCTQAAAGILQNPEALLEALIPGMTTGDAAQRMQNADSPDTLPAPDSRQGDLS